MTTNTTSIVAAKNASWIFPAQADPFIQNHLHCTCIGRGSCLDHEEFLPEGIDSDYLIFQVTGGNVSLIFAGEALALEKGDALIATPHSPLTLNPPSGEEATAEGTFCFAFLGGETAVSFLEKIIHSLGVVFSMEKNPDFEEAVNQFLHTASLPAMDSYQASLFAYNALVTLYRFSDCNHDQGHDHSPYPPLIIDALNLIKTDYAYLYGIDEVADKLGVAECHLIRTFTRHLGISPGKYLTQERIEHAKLLLICGDYSVEAVANMSGYANSNYFCKVFKKQTSLTPKQFAQNSGRRLLGKRAGKAETFLY